MLDQSFSVPEHFVIPFQTFDVSLIVLTFRLTMKSKNNNCTQVKLFVHGVSIVWMNEIRNKNALLYINKNVKYILILPFTN